MQLHLAIRCHHWELRNSALKLMAPLFMAYDRTTYQRLIPYNLADLQKFPTIQLKSAFAASINGGKGHAIALDETHEMCITKDLKWHFIQLKHIYRTCPCIYASEYQFTKTCCFPTSTMIPHHALPFLLMIHWLNRWRITFIQ